MSNVNFEDQKTTSSTTERFIVDIRDFFRSGNVAFDQEQFNSLPDSVKSFMDQKEFRKSLFPTKIVADYINSGVETDLMVEIMETIPNMIFPSFK